MPNDTDGMQPASGQENGPVFLGPTYAECEGRQDNCSTDECPKFGALGRPARDDKRRVRGCGDPVARGKRNRKKGQTRQNKASVRFGVAPVRDEEHLGGMVRREDKAGGRMANPVLTRFQLMEAQSEMARPMGDNRPFIAVFHPDGTKDSIVAFRLSQLEPVIAALAEQMGML